MLVVHVSLTPLAGSPIRIVRALNAHTDVEARLIDLSPNAYGDRTFPEDLVWAEHGDEARELLSRADVVHYHHWFDFASTSNPFGVDFHRSTKPGARSLIQWHSGPAFVAKNTGASETDLVRAEMPQMVMAQYHERYYPRAVPVPLVVEDAPATDAPPTPRRQRPSIFFSPSRSISAHADRWETKGKPEVVKVLQSLARRGLADPVVVQGAPFAECQRLRAGADVVIDDVVTGSYHTTSLEALAQGKATVAYLDSRTQAVLAELTGSTDLPLVNVHLDHLERVLEDLCRDPALVEELGSFSREWMGTHYRAADMVAHYVRCYDELLETGALVPPRYAQYARAKLWLYRDVPDLVWAAKRKALHSGALGDAFRRSTRRLRRHPAVQRLQERITGTRGAE